MVIAIANSTLQNGLRTEFVETYAGFRNRQSSGMLANLMNLNINATNRQHEFAYWESAPHFEEWRPGSTIPTSVMKDVGFTVPVYKFAKRVAWQADDRSDDQTQSLFRVAQQAGASAGLTPERIAFDLLTGTANYLPGIPNAPDGAALYATTAGGSARFGVTDGNLLTGNGVTSVANIRTDYYNALAQWKQFQDTEGQPLFGDEIVEGGVTIVHAAENLEAFEEAFLQRRQGELVAAGAGAATSNLTKDANRDVRLWATPRLTGNDWYMFLNSDQVMRPLFLMEREAPRMSTSLVGENNGDRTRDKDEEYVQWKQRSGGGIALPYATIKINN